MPQTPGIPDHAAPQPPWIARERKWIVGAVALASDAVAAGLVHGQALVYLTALIGIAGALGIRQIPNAPATGESAG